MALKQEHRFIGIGTPLGENVLALTGFSGHEEISRLFSFDLEMISEKESIAPDEIIGKNVTLTIQLSDDTPRCFNGFIRRLVADYGEGNETIFRAEMVPWLWFLTQTADCRIFQDKTVKEIIEQIFGDLGFSDYETAEIKGDHKKWEYCVQYRETDFNFISRLMEQEGIFYYFRHEDGKHTMVLADQVGAYKNLPEKEVESPDSAGAYAMKDHITDWEHHYEFTSGKWAQTDYNFKTPTTKLMTNTNSLVKLPGNDKYEIYDYPGDYPDKGVGDSETKIRMEEEEVPHNQVTGSSTCRTFTPGGKFTLTKHGCPAEEGKSYVITSIQHTASDPTYATGGGGETDYSNSFTCIPDSVIFRPARTTPKPVVQGVQTAIIVGPAGEEIYPDEYGRVKVQFHWDREGKRDENSSCWMRVSQVHAGKGFGGVDLPRIDEEVIVSFLEGDPDRPVITGRLYHAQRMPPYDLPAAKNVSGMKTNSTKGGGGYNELILDDTKDKEKITLHAQKDLDATIEHNETRKVVTGTQTVTVKGDTSLTVEVGNRTVSVQSGSYTGTAKKSITLHGQSEGVGVRGDAKGVSVTGTGKGVSIYGEPNVIAHGSSNATIKSPTVDIGDKVINVMGTDITIKGTTIILDGGGGMIKLDGSGVMVTGPMIKSAASGNHDITGALVKIN